MLHTNGVMFSRDKQGFFPEIMEVMYDERKAWKKKMIEYQKEKEKTTDAKRLKELSTLIKGIQQSTSKKDYIELSVWFYGESILCFGPNLAEAITYSGQLVIKWSEKIVNRYLNQILKTDNEDYVIAIDTDSIYLTMDKFVNTVMFGVKQIETKLLTSYLRQSLRLKMFLMKVSKNLQIM